MFSKVVTTKVFVHFTSSHLHIIKLSKGYAYLVCCPGRGLRARRLARPQSAPPSASPRAGVERAKGVESGWWRDAESRDNGGRTYLVIYRRFLVR